MKKLFSLLLCLVMMTMSVVTMIVPASAASDYVTQNGFVADGLVAIWDGEQNTLGGHDAKSAVWADLSGNGNDIALELNDLVSWGDDSLNLGLQGKVPAPAAVNEAILGNAFTFQIKLDKYEYAADRTNGWTAWLIGIGDNGMPFTFYYHFGQKKIFVQTQNTTGGKFDVACAIDLVEVPGKVLTVTYEVGGNMDVYVDEDLYGRKAGVPAPIAKMDGKVWGFNGYAHKNNSADYMEQEGIVFYNRALTEAEIIANVKAFKNAKVVPMKAAETTTAAPVTTKAPETTIAPAATTKAPAQTPATADNTLPVAITAMMLAAAAILAAKKKKI